MKFHRFNIKTVSFIQNDQNVIPIFSLGSGFQLQFDDLYGNEANFYYEIIHCDYNWKPSEIPKKEYLQGFDNQRIQNYTNSFNITTVLPLYIVNPNQFTQQLRISGDYMLKILNDDKDVVFTRKFILYENLVTVPMQVKRTRTVSNVEYKHNLDFSIKSNTITFSNSFKNVKSSIAQMASSIAQ
jgi:hypothetical protein